MTLNCPLKRQSARAYSKQNPKLCYIYKTHIKLNGTGTLKIKDWATVHQ